MHIHSATHTHIHTHTHTHTTYTHKHNNYTHTYSNTCRHTSMHTYRDTHQYMHTCSGTHVHTQSCAQTHGHTECDIYKNTTHTRTHILIRYIIHQHTKAYQHTLGLRLLCSKFYLLFFPKILPIILLFITYYSHKILLTILHAGNSGVR